MFWEHAVDKLQIGDRLFARVVIVVFFPEPVQISHILVDLFFGVGFVFFEFAAFQTLADLKRIRFRCMNGLNGIGVFYTWCLALNHSLQSRRPTSCS